MEGVLSLLSRIKNLWHRLFKKNKQSETPTEDYTYYNQDYYQDVLKAFPVCKIY